MRSDMEREIEMVQGDQASEQEIKAMEEVLVH